MDKFVIRGGNPLLGTIRISGAKNAALPAMAAALLTDEPVILENIPHVRDIETTRKLLGAMGAEVELGYGRAQHRTTICARNLTSPEASYDLVKQMRAPAAAPSERDQSIFTSKDWNNSAPKSLRITDTSKPPPTA
jgi:UDP-N-acetylglucosamine 1-carboxyvinyltransferase